MKKIFYDKDWKQEYRSLVKGNILDIFFIERLLDFIEQQKEFSYLAGHAEGLKEGLYEKEKIKDAEKKLYENQKTK